MAVAAVELLAGCGGALAWLLALLIQTVVLDELVLHVLPSPRSETRRGEWWALSNFHWGMDYMDLDRTWRETYRPFGGALGFYTFGARLSQELRPLPPSEDNGHEARKTPAIPALSGVRGVPAAQPPSVSMRTFLFRVPLLGES